MATTYNLNEATKPVKLDANGNGTAFITPSGTEKWLITRYAVHVDQPLNSTKMPICSLYQDSPDPSNLLDATYTGAQDAGDFTTPLILEKGQPIYVVWTGGISGTSGVLSLTGTKELY